MNNSVKTLIVRSFNEGHQVCWNDMYIQGGPDWEKGEGRGGVRYLQKRESFLTQTNNM